MTNNPNEHPVGIDPQTGEPFIDRRSKLFKMSHAQRTFTLWTEQRLNRWETEKLAKDFYLTCYVVDAYIQMHNLHPSLLSMADGNLRGYKKLAFSVALKIAKEEVKYHIHLCNAVLDLSIEDAIAKIDEMVKVRDMHSKAKLRRPAFEKVKSPRVTTKSKSRKKSKKSNRRSRTRKPRPVVVTKPVADMVPAPIAPAPKEIVFIDPLAKAREIAKGMFGERGERNLLEPNLDGLIGDSGRAERTS